MVENVYVRTLASLSAADVGIAGGKNASLGEMQANLSRRGIRVPGGFATTSEAYWEFLESGGLRDEIRRHLADWDAGEQTLAETGEAIRGLMLATPLPAAVTESVVQAYRALSEQHDGGQADVAVRSSATAEDLPEASFAGQQETFLNVTGETDVLLACRQCYASLFTDRAISYREEHGFDHLDVALSVGVQKMVRSDLASSGVMFTLDTETGFPDVVFINAAWGLGEKRLPDHRQDPGSQGSKDGSGGGRRVGSQRRYHVGGAGRVGARR
jgi:pyruvate,water dikinase